MDNPAGASDAEALNSLNIPDELSLVKSQLAKTRVELERERAHLQSVIGCVPGILWTMDQSGLPKFFSKASQVTTDLCWQTIEVHGWPALVDDDQRDAALKTWIFNLLKESFGLEWALRQQDGSTAWYLISAQPSLDKNGSVEKWFGSCTNIDAEKKLAAALQTALKTRSEFVAHISHELRTPLNGILPMVELMLRGELSDEARAHALTLREAGSSLLNIINDILDFSKLEAGKISPTKVEFNLVTIVEGVAQILTPAAASKNLFLLTSIASAVPVHVVGDPQRLRQILLNLCSNAIKCTDQGHVVIKVAPANEVSGGTDLAFTVTDTGPGLNHDLMEHLFEPFFQGSGETYRPKAGTGLGLSISKQFVELMGGKIYVVTEPGAGSTFGFTVPLPIGANADSSDVWLPIAWKSDLLNVLTFEPCYEGRGIIGEALEHLGIRVQSIGNIEMALSMLKRNVQKAATRQVILVDMIRYQVPSRELLHQIQAGNLSDGLTVIEVVANGSSAIEDFENCDQRRITLVMPIQRQTVIKCFASLEESWRRGPEKISATTTLRLDTVPEISPTDKTKLEGQEKQVLVADDNEVNRHVAKSFLTDMGLHVDLAMDGVEAVQAFKSKHYDLVFLDCQMPRLDGFGAAKIIKGLQSRTGIAVPVIAITANAVEGTREECLAHDMDDYLSKPIDPLVLERLVETWLGRTPKRLMFEKTSQTVLADGAGSATSLVNLTELRKVFSPLQIKKHFGGFHRDRAGSDRRIETAFGCTQLHCFGA